MSDKLYFAGSEILGFYILHLNGKISDNNGCFFCSVEEANFYCGFGDSVLPMFVEVNYE